MKETLKIAFGDLSNRDVQRNDLKTGDSSPKDVSYSEILEIAKKSFFRNVYQQALEQISMIVQQNLEQVSDQTSDQLYKHDIQNIIAFTGRRGTGKTSAMMSLAEFLSNHELLIEHSKDRVSFKLLAEIDATSLDRKVSLIPAILSQIITSLNKELYCSNCGRKYSETEKHTIQEIYKTANQLFSDYITGIHTSSNVGDASNYLSIASKRLSFEKSFRDLIRNYAENFFKNKISYFIICIDDADMAPYNHAELLINIHQYLMIPNIIVMLTTNLKFLAPEVQTLFYKNATPAYDTLAVDRLSTEQTEEYLKKIIPSDNRITLPSWKKKDYLSIFPIKISFYDNSVKGNSITEIKSRYSKLDKSEFFAFIDKKSKDDKPFLITPKELILMMIANRTKVYLDVCGMKYHFFEPSSLRNMYDLFYILYNMNNIVEKYDQRDSNDYYLERSQNRKRLLDYIHFTLRRDYRFDAQTSEFLDELIAYPIERRGQKIWGYYYQLLDSEGISQRIDSAYGKGFRPTEKHFFKTEKYSFGEFFRILYTSSRIGVFDHKFIKFILASYSMALPAFVENEKRKSNQEDGHYRQLVALFGSSLIGTVWCDELFGCNLIQREKIIETHDNANGVTIEREPFAEYETYRCSIAIPIHPNRTVDVRELEKLISLLLLSPHWVTETPIEVKKNYDEWIIDAELDPTSFLINCLLINEKIRDIHDTKTHNKTAEIFKYNNQTLTLSGLIMTIYQGFDLSSKDYCELKVTDEKGEYVKDDKGQYIYIINRNADKPESIKENGIPKDYINAYHDLIIQINNDGNHKIDDTFTIPLRDDKDNPITDEKGVQIKGKGTIVDIILDYLVQDYRAHHLANMLKHIDLIYNTIKRTITDIVYITSHDVVKKKKRFENAGEPAFIIADFYMKLIKQLKDTDKVYFAKGTEADYSFATRFETSAIVKNVCSMAGCSDSKLRLKADEIKEPSDNQDKTTDNQDKTATLKKVFDDILPIAIYVDFASEYMFALIGHFANSLDNYLTTKQVQSITTIIMKSFSEIAVGRVDERTDKEMNAIILKEIKRAEEEIQEKLDTKKSEVSNESST